MLRVPKLVLLQYHQWHKHQEYWFCNNHQQSLFLCQLQHQHLPIRFPPGDDEGDQRHRPRRRKAGKSLRTVPNSQERGEIAEPALNLGPGDGGCWRGQELCAEPGFSFNRFGVHGILGQVLAAAAQYQPGGIAAQLYPAIYPAYPPTPAESNLSKTHNCCPAGRWSGLCQDSPQKG